MTNTDIRAKSFISHQKYHAASTADNLELENGGQTSEIDKLRLRQWKITENVSII